LGEAPHPDAECFRRAGEFPRELYAVIKDDSS
jgi:hypothetical protein